MLLYELFAKLLEVEHVDIEVVDQSMKLKTDPFRFLFSFSTFILLLMFE